jgi:hypothetical protein
MLAVKKIVREKWTVPNASDVIVDVVGMSTEISGWRLLWQLES